MEYILLWDYAVWHILPLGVFMKKIRNWLANATVICLIACTAITIMITAICTFQVINAPEGSIGNNFIRNVNAIADYNRELVVNEATIGKRG